MHQTLPLILASSSPARAELLRKLKIPFTCVSPDIDETPYPQENAEALVKRLAQEKAQAIANRQAKPSLIIGSDQVAVLPNGTILGKPKTFPKAQAQLRQMSGQTIAFHTGLCLLDTHAQAHEVILETTQVRFRSLSDADIQTYLDKDQPFNCAGGFRSEGLGITLATAYTGRDPNTLIGLPLMALVDLLKKMGHGDRI